MCGGRIWTNVWKKRLEAVSPAKATKKDPHCSPLHSWEWPGRPWPQIHVGHVGPFTGKMFLMIVDAHSKWMDIHCMCEIRQIEHHYWKAKDHLCFTGSTRDFSVRQWVQFCEQRIQVIPKEERQQAHYFCSLSSRLKWPRIIIIIIIITLRCNHVCVVTRSFVRCSCIKDTTAREKES